MISSPVLKAAGAVSGHKPCNSGFVPFLTGHAELWTMNMAYKQDAKTADAL